MNRNQSTTFVILITVLFILLLVLSFYSHRFKKVELDKMYENDNLVVEYNINDDYIKGYIYDDSQAEMFTNWIMGTGYSYYCNFYFFENCNGDLIYLPTYSAYDSLIFSDYIENYNVSALDFFAVKNNSECKLGVVIKDMKGIESYRYLNEVNTNE